MMSQKKMTQIELDNLKEAKQKIAPFKSKLPLVRNPRVTVKE